MKKNKGFTLVELLAVIAILAILVIIALPNVMGMFNQAKKESFTTELKEIYKVAQQQWMSDSLMSTGDQTYSRCSNCTGKSLQLTGRNELEYYIKLDKSGKVVEYYATDGTYQFSYTGDLLATQINDVEEVAKLDEDDIIKITPNMAINSSPFSVGDYISYTPVKTSYQINSSSTGYSPSQTINPSSLNKWRVIRVNSDNTVDIVSDNTTDNYIYFNGKTGFLNYVGALNEIAKQFETEGITVGSRNVGYNGQTEVITDTSKIIRTIPWGCNTGETCSNAPVESQGGGDKLSEVDKDLIKAVYGSLKTNPNRDYYISSRWYSNVSYGNVEHYWGISLSGSSSSLYGYVSTDGGWKIIKYLGYIRPIVTLKAKVKITSGEGSESSPYVISQ